MITEEVIQSILRALRPTNISITDEGVVKFEVDRVVISTDISDFEEYIRVKGSSHQLTETSLFAAGYLEQAIEAQGRSVNTFRVVRDSDEFTLTHSQTGFVVKIGPISPKFVMFLTDTDTMHRDFRRISMLRRPMLRGRDDVSLGDLFARILSVKVIAPLGHSFYENIKQLKSIAESSLYNVSYGYGISLVPVKSWERSLHFLSSKNKESVQFPLRTYNQELVAYYHMALGADSLILSYLAFYKILEYFFTAASENLLHDKIREQLVAPDFSHTKVNKLRELAKAIRRFDQKMDERRMLQTVFEQYIDKEDMRIWLDEFDKDNSAYFTTERDLFGKRGQELIIDIISVLVTLFANSFGLFRRVWCLGIRADQ